LIIQLQLGVDATELLPSAVLEELLLPYQEWDSFCSVMRALFNHGACHALLYELKKRKFINYLPENHHDFAQLIARLFVVTNMCDEPASLLPTGKELRFRNGFQSLETWFAHLGWIEQPASTYSYLARIGAQHGRFVHRAIWHMIHGRMVTTYGATGKRSLDLTKIMQPTLLIHRPHEPWWLWLHRCDLAGTTPALIECAQPLFVNSLNDFILGVHGTERIVRMHQLVLALQAAKAVRLFKLEATDNEVPCSKDFVVGKADLVLMKGKRPQDLSTVSSPDPIKITEIKTGKKPRYKPAFAGHYDQVCSYLQCVPPTQEVSGEIIYVNTHGIKRSPVTVPMYSQPIGTPPTVARLIRATTLIRRGFLHPA